MSRVLRLALTLVFLLLPVGTAIVGGWREANVRVSFDISDAPRALGEYVAARDERLEPRVFEAVQPDEHIMRLYAADDGSYMWLYVAFYSGYGATSAHDPSVCFPSQGWDLSALKDREVALPDGDTLTAQMFLAAQRGHHELVLYWFQPPGRWPRATTQEPYFRVYDAFSGRKRHAFVRLSMGAEPDEASGTSLTEERLAGLAAELAPWVRRAVEGRVAPSARPERRGVQRANPS